jgi:hypothetical protein
MFSNNGQQISERDNIVYLGDYITGFTKVERKNHYSYSTEGAEKGSIIDFSEARHSV